MKTVLLVLALLLVVATVLPLFRHDAWWIRVFDFPRLQIAVLAAVVLSALLVNVQLGQPLDTFVVAALALALLFQVYRIFFYTPLAQRQVRDANAGTTSPALSLMVANVQMENRDSDRFLEIVGDAEPDILLTLEPDAWWEDKLQTLEATYPYTVKKPLDNRYGMLLHSKLALLEPEIKTLVREGVPSIHTKVRLDSGDLIQLHCVHPEPPSPTEADSATPRDAELLIVGKVVKDAAHPVIVTGDLNDVAWSRTTRLFQRTSGLLDPRIGRGMFNSFNAKVPLMRWPLDHVFHSDDFLLRDMARLPAFGSDHFPIRARLTLAAGAGQLQKAPDPLDNSEKERVDEKIQRAAQRASP